MKVKELIENLKELNQEAKVMIWLNDELEEVEDMDNIYVLDISKDSWPHSEFRIATEKQKNAKETIVLG